jgi:hypothetical protein
MERQQFDSSRVAGEGKAPVPPQEETPGTVATPSDFATAAFRRMTRVATEVVSGCSTQVMRDMGSHGGGGDGGGGDG